MNAIVKLIVFSGIVLSVKAALPKIGNCSYEQYNNKIRTCTTRFIKGLQQNPKEDCNVHRETIIKCSAVAVQTCIPSLSVERMRNALKLQLTEELMCKKAGLQFPDPSQFNFTLPCNITTSEYMTKNNECSDRMVKKWSANRADPTLCSEYRNVKQCMKNITDKYCQFDGDWLELAKYQFDNYNPFCQTDVNPESKGSSVMLSKAAFVISLVVAVTQAF